MQLREVLQSAWPARVAWAALPLTVGPALGEALDGRSRPVQLAVVVAAWAVWSAVLAASLVPRSSSLTALRILAPLAAAAGVWAAAAGGDVGAPAVLAAGWSALVLVTAFSPWTGEVFVDGSSYGDERRFPLRVPAPLLLGPIPLAWALAVGPPVAALLLLAGRQWVLAAIVAAAGLPLAAAAVRVLHGLARRWVVFVPAGMVLHDPMVLSEPVLVPRRTVASLRPALAGTDAVDLTRNALGLALELRTVEPQRVGVLRPRREGGRDEVEAGATLITPTRPGAVLAEAARRGIPT